MPVTLSSLHIYPVKGLGAIELAEAEVTPRGLRHDRRFMVVDPSGEFFTQRDFPKMATVWTEIEGATLSLAAPDAGEIELEAEPDDGAPIRVRVWNSSGVEAIAPSAEADAWLSDYLDTRCRLVYMPDHSRRATNPNYGGEHIVSFADGYPFLFTNEASLADLNVRLSHPVPMNRFRPNLVVKGAPSYAEDGWKELAVGGVRFRMVKPCGRCQVTTTDQTTGEVMGPEPLSVLSTYRSDPTFGALFGMNAVALSEGTVRVGDTLRA
jgi:MOSC domain-containing protein